MCCNVKVAVIGAGNIGSAIASALLKPWDDEFEITHVAVTVSSPESLKQVEADFRNRGSHFSATLSNDNAAVAQDADVIILAFEPIQRHSVFEDDGFKQAIEGKLVINIMAGITFDELHRLASTGGARPQFIRATPNMAAKIRGSMTLYTPDPKAVSSENGYLAHWLFQQFGLTEEIEDASFDTLSVLNGCTASLLLLAIDGLLDAAVAEGLERSAAAKMAVQSAIEVMSMVPEPFEHPSVLRDKIASPGGCPSRAVGELEKLGVRSAFTSAMLKAVERYKEMSST